MWLVARIQRSGHASVARIQKGGHEQLSVVEWWFSVGRHGGGYQRISTSITYAPITPATKEKKKNPAMIVKRPSELPIIR